MKSYCEEKGISRFRKCILCDSPQEIIAFRIRPLSDDIWGYYCGHCHIIWFEDVDKNRLEIKDIDRLSCVMRLMPVEKKVKH